METVEQPAGWRAWPRNIKRWWANLTTLQKFGVIVLAILAGIALIAFIKGMFAKFAAEAAVEVLATTAICRDGWESRAVHCKGQCSHHEGVGQRIAGCAV